MTRCRWIHDAEVPGGKFLVPGCWNRTIHGDDADCQCEDDPETVEDRIAALSRQLALMKAELAELRAAAKPRGC